MQQRRTGTGQVRITVNGRSYKIGCDAGEEDRIVELGQYLDGRVAELAARVGQVGDERLLLMTALVLADDLAEAVADLEADGVMDILVTVQGGIHLGADPYDPTGTATWESSLDWFLQEKGYALGDLGGITHQTVSGFLLTGSSGGSLMHSIDDQIVGMRVLDGEGNAHDLGPDDDAFWAVGVSMGLLGVVSTVTFRVMPTFDLFGDQVTVETDDPDAPVAAAPAPVAAAAPAAAAPPSPAGLPRERA